MEKTCKECRFFENTKCAKFNITVNENYIKCGDFAQRCSINESQCKIKLHD